VIIRWCTLGDRRHIGVDSEFSRKGTRDWVPIVGSAFESCYSASGGAAVLHHEVSAIGKEGGDRVATALADKP
jgi:hypothetical protein